MKVTIQGLEVSVETIDELQELIQRFGSGEDGEPKIPKSSRQPLNGNGDNSVAHDRVLLQTLVDAGESGVHTNSLGDMLGRKGKAVGPGLLAWAVKIHLTADATNNPFEKARPAGGRGWKLKNTMMGIAKELLQNMK